jgi:hypothetical protein
MSTNRRVMPENLAPRRSLDLSGLHAVLEPQSCDVLVYMGIESPSCKRGLAAKAYPGDLANIDKTIAASLRTGNIEEICTPSSS